MIRSWDVTPCSLLENYQSFGRTYTASHPIRPQSSHLPPSEQSHYSALDPIQISPAHPLTLYVLKLYFTLLVARMNGLLFGPEDGGSEFLRNVKDFYQTTCHHIPEDSNLHIHHCDSLRSHILILFSKLRLGLVFQLKFYVYLLLMRRYETELQSCKRQYNWKKKNVQLLLVSVQDTDLRRSQEMCPVTWWRCVGWEFPRLSWIALSPQRGSKARSSYWPTDRNSVYI
jgi:hypothetical protein